MIKHSTWLHLRIPFSLLLLPIYLFALSVSQEVVVSHALLVFFILHFLLYPASNGYNSYFDKDEESIGGLKNPPQVSRELYYTSLVLDLTAILLGLLISWPFALMLIIYGLISKAYSHPAIRLKKYPFVGWFVAGTFQGFFSFVMVYMATNNLTFQQVFFRDSVLWAAFLSTLLLWGSYSMTQVYQHKEDSKRGDKTLSLVLGIKGTFHFTAIVFFIATICFVAFYITYFDWYHALVFLLLVLPMLLYFLLWYIQVKKTLDAVTYEATMKLNMISALCLNTCFLIFFVWRFF